VIIKNLLIVSIGLMLAPPVLLAQQVPGVQGCVGAGCDAPVEVPGVQGCVGMGCKCSQAQLDGGMVDTELGCRKNCKAAEAMDAYKRDLKIATGLWEDADEEGDRALEEFHETGDEILKEMGLGGIGKTAEETLPKIGEHILEETGTAKTLLIELPQTAEIPITVGTTLVEMGTAVHHVSAAVDNLDYATQSEAEMRARGDQKWKQALENLERAKADEAACAAANKALDEKVKADRALEKQARRYMEEGGIIGPDGRVTKVYYVGNQEFRDAGRALDAAKELVAHRKQSGALDRRGVPARAALMPGLTVAGAPADEIKEAITDISIAETHIRKGMTSVADRLKQYQKMRKQLRALRSQIQAKP